MGSTETKIFIGCAGWSIPGHSADRFSSSGTHLERYAHAFPAVEINTTFYRSHRPETYTRWAASTPPGFRFAVKVHRLITHYHRLRVPTLLKTFASETSALKDKLGPWLVQLPPSLAFDAGVVTTFFAGLRDMFNGLVVCEPRNASWFTPSAEALLREYQVARAAVDPALNPSAAIPGGWPEPVYFRLHGSPIMYHSPYSREYLAALGRQLAEACQAGKTAWCIFDNTATSAAFENALDLLELLSLR